MQIIQWNPVLQTAAYCGELAFSFVLVKSFSVDIDNGHSVTSVKHSVIGQGTSPLHQSNVSIQHDSVRFILSVPIDPLHK